MKYVVAFLIALLIVAQLYECMTGYCELQVSQPPPD